MAQLTIETFGDMLYFFRRSFGERMNRRYRGLPPMGNLKKSAAKLVEEMKEAGYDISPSTYTEIEQGKMFPKDSELFIEKFSQSVGIETNSKDQLALKRQLAFDIVRRRAGDGIARTIEPMLTTPEGATRQPEDPEVPELPDDPEDQD